MDGWMGWFTLGWRAQPALSGVAPFDPSKKRLGRYDQAGFTGGRPNRRLDCYQGSTGRSLLFLFLLATFEVVLSVHGCIDSRGLVTPVLVGERGVGQGWEGLEAHDDEGNLNGVSAMGYGTRRGQGMEQREAKNRRGDGEREGRRKTKTYLDVLALLIHNHDLHNKVLNMRRDRFLANGRDELAEAHREALLALLLPDERAPEHADALRDHADLELVLGAEPVDDLAQRRVVVELEAVPQRPLRAPVLVLRRRDRLGEPKERQREVHEAVFVVLELVLAVDDLHGKIKIRSVCEGEDEWGRDGTL